MIFVDSNIPMYLVGAPHAHKADAQRLLERCVAAEERLVTDAEALQEILHRYGAIDRRDFIQPAVDALLGVVDHIFPVTDGDALRAKDIMLGTRGISARDALHVAIMQTHGIESILTFDRGFDRVPGVVRVQ